MVTLKKFNSEIVNTVIGSETEFKGDIQSQGSVRLDGKMEGTISAQGEIIIGETARLKGNIVGKRVLVSGEVIGDIEAISGLDISHSGRVYGDISGGRLLIEEGAVYKGKVNMDVISTDSLYEGKLEVSLPQA